MPSVLDRDTFEDQFPVMYKFYLERGRLTELQQQKVKEVQQRWKTGCVFWLTYDNQEVEIPEWVAVNVVLNNKLNLAKSQRICMSLNHTKGYGCNRMEKDGQCNYVHECALCGQDDHGVFMTKRNGDWVCNKLRKWHEEEARFVESGYGEIRGQEAVLMDLAQRPRGYQPPPKAAIPKSKAVPPKVNGAGRPPEMPQPQPYHPPQQQQAVQRQQEQQRPLPVTPPPPAPSIPPPPQLPKDWEAIWNQERFAYYYWHHPTNKTSWDVPSSDAEVAGAHSNGGYGVDAGAKPPDNLIAQENEFICIQHWRPQPGDPCLRVFQGERLIVTWADEDQCSWVYGHAVDEPDKSGYFPRQVLKRPQRRSISRRIGEFYTVVEGFEAPEEVGGYSSIKTGEFIKVLFDAKAPCAWAYVEPVSCQGSLQIPREPGWVPESCLAERVVSHLP
eukprot:TRINITY_DN66049_c0_g1_i1.p1 TRINITY_DN66049_c0_g1~~TRINITY_DN66049_c0_g1_i1.p1  ORF type:complete len:462 (+),score=68.91 TRINITY_DN66049_c0_g1_i1:59-1387(+)